MKYTKIKKIKTNILDIVGNKIYPAEISIKEGYFQKIIPLKTDSDLDFNGIMVPGFIDAHIHIESSLLTPTNFAKAVVPYGTTSVIADPHEIANVCGVEGIEFMINDSTHVPFDFYFSAPSCVPATSFETSGASLDSVAIEKLMKKDEVVALGEVMNFVGVVNRDDEIIDKLKIAKKYNKPIDGHSPMLYGEDLEKYVNVDDTFIISTDHESVSFDEAIEKKKLGMKIMVREGSSAKNMEALFNMKSRIALCSNQDFFGSVSVTDFQSVLKNPIFDFIVSDDKDPNDLKKGHLNILIKKAIDLGIDPIEAVKMVTINPAEHYNLNSGIIEVGKKANFVLIDNFNNFNIKRTYIGGKLVAEDGNSYIDSEKSHMRNTFILDKKNRDDFDVSVGNSFNSSISSNSSNYCTSSISSINVRIIELIKNEIITNEIDKDLLVKNGIIQANIDEDILKLAVVERYGNNNKANAFIKGFGLKKGAIASSVAHDSHNIIVVGTNSNDMARAVNLISENKGGLAVVYGKNENILKLPIAGLMSDEDAFTVSNQLEIINNEVTNLGSSLEAPFMTLSFMALLVIPNLRLSDKGLFDVNKFSFVDLIKN